MGKPTIGVGPGGGVGFGFFEVGASAAELFLVVAGDSHQ